MDASEFEELAGERLQEWIDHSLTIEGGYRRLPNQYDIDEFGGDEDSVAWVFTQKGQRLYESYLRKLHRLAEKKFPDESWFDIEQHTGIIYP